MIAHQFRISQPEFSFNMRDGGRNQFTGQLHVNVCFTAAHYTVQYGACILLISCTQHHLTLFTVADVFHNRNLKLPLWRIDADLKESFPI